MIKTTKEHHMDGFHMTFANGYTVSVQVGEHVYAKNGTAEVGAWGPDGEWVELGPDFGQGSTSVLGWCDADTVAAVIEYVCNLEVK